MMSEKSLSDHLDDATFEAAERLSEADGKTTSQIAAAGIQVMTGLQPAAREVLHSMGETLTDAEIKHVMRVAGRSLMSAYRRTLMDRYADNIQIECVDGGTGKLTEEQIEEIAVKACK